MKQRRLMLGIAVLLTLGLVSLGMAQMSGTQDGHVSQADAGSMSGCGMMSHKMMNDSDSATGSMTQHCQMMSKDFDELESHFEKMMQIDDVDELKAEMQRHHEMMRGMHGNMMERQQMCQRMNSTTKSSSCGMHGMMGCSAMKSNDSDQKSPGE